MDEGKKSIVVSMGIIFFISIVTLSSLIFFKVRAGEMAKIMENEEYEEYGNYYVMIVNDQTSEFWESVFEGAREDGQENNVYVELLGTNLSEDYTREELMEIAIQSKVDGIIVEADESERMTELVNEATAEQIPVVTVFGDNMASGRKSFVGVGSYNMGREYGRQVIKLCKEEAKNVLILMSGGMEGTSQNVLYSGIQETIEKELPGDKSVYLDMKTVDNERTFSAEESIRDIFMNSDRLPDIIICLDELSTSCVYQAVVDYNMVGEIDIIGYYDSLSILQAIERKVVYSIITIDTNQMGKFCVEALNEYHELGNVSEYFTVDITVIDSENVEEYLRGGADEQ